MPHISVVIPVYNAEACLPALYNRLKTTLSTITSDFEILLVEDCGYDRSWETILELTKCDNRVKGVKLSRNFGQHYAITAGLDHCNSDWVVVMDCDLQDQPEEIPKLYYKALEGYDVVLANRGKRQDPLIKRVFSWIFYKIYNYLLDLKHDSQVGNFRIISRKVVRSLRELREQLRFFGGLVSWMGYPSATVEVQHANRYAGKSSYTFKKLFTLASDTIIAYSDKPLKMVIKLGFLISIVAFLYGFYIFTSAFIHHSPVPGWTSLIISFYLLGGMIIAILGVIGVYLEKTFNETKKRPLYIISETTFESPN